MRELRALVRRCTALKANHTQEINRQKAGLVCGEVSASIKRLLGHIEEEIRAICAAIRALIARDRTLQLNFELLRSIPGLGEVTAALVLAELPDIAEFTPPRAWPPLPGCRPRSTVPARNDASAASAASATRSCVAPSISVR